MIELPTTIIEAETTNPTSLIIYSSPKVGKTTAVAQLGEKALLVDLEKGSREVSAQKITVNTLEELKEVLKAVNKAGNPYPIGVLDTLTTLEDIVLPYARDLYRATSMGKNFPTDQNILTLPKGGGYYYLRMAMIRVLKAFADAFQFVIYTAHLRDTSLGIEGKEINVQDISLTGQLKSIVSAQVSAIGYMYRKDNKTILSFVNKGGVIAGARPAHLRNKEIVLLESDEDGKLINRWNEVYLGLEDI